MFGLLQRPERKPRAFSPRRFLPRLELLEGRDLPSTLTLAVSSYGAGKSVTLTGHLSDTGTPANQTIYITGQAAGNATTNSNGDFTITLTAAGLGTVCAQTPGSNQASTTLTDATYSLVTFAAIEGTGGLWDFRGTVSYGGRPVEGLTVYFGGGPVSLVGKTATVDANGNFEVFVQLNGTSSDNGTAMAGSQDPWGIVSNMIYESIHQTGT